LKNYCQSIYLIVDKLFIDNKIILIENSIKIISNYLLSIKLVIDNQEKSMKTRFHQQSLIDNRLKKLNTATLILHKKSIILFKLLDLVRLVDVLFISFCSIQFNQTSMSEH
jgi:hypothetical protein